MPRPRVEIRAPTRADREEFIGAMLASRSLHRPWSYPPETPDAFERMLARAQTERYESLLVCRGDDGALVGYFNLSEIIRGALQSAFLGYGAVAAHCGQGYMTEGLGLVLAHAFGALGLHRVEANVQPANVRSAALVRRCGFVHEGFAERYLKVGGRWCDHDRYAIRVEQWRSEP